MNSCFLSSLSRAGRNEYILGCTFSLFAVLLGPSLMCVLYVCVYFKKSDEKTSCDILLSSVTETAENIGYSCELLTDETTIYYGEDVR